MFPFEQFKYNGIPNIQGKSSPDIRIKVFLDPEKQGKVSIVQINGISPGTVAWTAFLVEQWFRKYFTRELFREDEPEKEQNSKFVEHESESECEESHCNEDEPDENFNTGCMKIAEIVSKMSHNGSDIPAIAEELVKQIQKIIVN